MYVPIWEEDRKPLDSRRLAAVLLDGLIIAPVLIPLSEIFGSVDRSAWLIYVACSLTYFHVMETRTGQTIGKRALDLRVVSRADAGPASAKAISIRTVLRLLDGFPGAYVLGAITMLATGKRRQRLGDLAAGTVVTRASARQYTPARRSPLVTIYPALWIGAAVAIAIWIARADDRFLAKVDRLCKDADKATSALAHKTLDRQLAIRVDLERRISRLRVADEETRNKQLRILQILDLDAQLAYKLIQDYRATGSQEQFRTGSVALVESSEDHSAQLSREFGLGNC